MKVLLFLPCAPDSPTGNAVTARRIAKNLTKWAAEVSLAELRPDATLDTVLAAIDREGPDVLHWYHAWKTARWLPEVMRMRRIPSVITLTGTDINRDAADPQRRETVLAALRAADAVVTCSKALGDRANVLLGKESHKVSVIEKGVDLGTARYDLPADGTRDRVLFLLPAGIRPEKNNRFAVRALDAVHAADPRVRLLLAGPVLDEGYAAALQNDLVARPWVSRIETIPHDAMASVYGQATVVLNTSLSEGLSNSILEAMACGRPVLASNVEGNRQAVDDDATGLLYRDEADFVAKASLLASDAALRQRLGEAARHRVRRAEYAALEAASLDGTYHAITRILHLDIIDAGYDPRGPVCPPPIFEGAGRLREARSPRVGADHAVRLVGEMFARVTQFSPVVDKVVWEVGCGSGVLAALCARLGAKAVWATDIDEEALALARETARLNGVRVNVARADLMDTPIDIHPEVVIANLPQKPVPPGLSLPAANDGGPDGARVLVPFLEQAARRLKPGADLYLFRHSLVEEGPVRSLLDRAFELRWDLKSKRFFYDDEFPTLLPYWRERRGKGLCCFDDLSPGRHVFECTGLHFTRK